MGDDWTEWTSQRGSVIYEIHAHIRYNDVHSKYDEWVRLRDMVENYKACNDVEIASDKFLVLGPTTCCLEKVSYNTIDDIPLEDVLCPCGNSYFIKYEKKGNVHEM